MVIYTSCLIICASLKEIHLIVYEELMPQDLGDVRMVVQTYGGTDECNSLCLPLCGGIQIHGIKYGLPVVANANKIHRKTTTVSIKKFTICYIVHAIKFSRCVCRYGWDFVSSDENLRNIFLTFLSVCIRVFNSSKKPAVIWPLQELSRGHNQIVTSQLLNSVIFTSSEITSF
jgi:hypothetical protein